MSIKKLKVVNYIVVHCSATIPENDIGFEEINKWHMDKGWDMCGYHQVIRRGGILEHGRNLDKRGAHVKGHNWESVGICMVGGINIAGEPEDNFDDDQYETLKSSIKYLKLRFPNAEVCGHRDFSPDLNGDGVITENEFMKHCPCFDVKSWLETWV